MEVGLLSLRVLDIFVRSWNAAGDTENTGKFAEKAMMRSDLSVYSRTLSATKFQEVPAKRVIQAYLSCKYPLPDPLILFLSLFYRFAPSPILQGESDLKGQTHLSGSAVANGSRGRSQLLLVLRCSVSRCGLRSVCMMPGCNDTASAFEPTFV